MRDGFIFYASWLEAIKSLPREIQGEVFTAIIEYGLYGKTTEAPKPITSAMLALVKPQIDVNNKRYENGKKGGRKPAKESVEETISEEFDKTEEPNGNQTETKSEPNSNQTLTKVEPNENQKETKFENLEPKDKDKDIYKETTTKVVAKKGEKTIAALAATNERKQEFYQSLIPFVDRYGKEMIREFFNYWSEMNKSKTKMRFEGEKTWETDLRLATWERRSKKNGVDKHETKPVEETGYGSY